MEFKMTVICNSRTEWEQKIKEHNILKELSFGIPKLWTPSEIINKWTEVFVGFNLNLILNDRN